jgi:hypothetical protein
VYGKDYPNGSAVHADIVALRISLHVANSVILGSPPTRRVLNTAYPLNAFMWIVMLAFSYARNLLCHIHLLKNGLLVQAMAWSGPDFYTMARNDITQ